MSCLTKPSPHTPYFGQSTSPFFSSWVSWILRSAYTTLLTTAEEIGSWLSQNSWDKSPGGAVVRRQYCRLTHCSLQFNPDRLKVDAAFHDSSEVLYHLHKKVKNISRKSERSKRKTAQTVLLVVAVFLISWLPHHIITMWAEFGQFPLNNISFTFRIISHCLAYGNSCINPIIYAFLSENFRNACRQVFTCKFLLQPAPADKLVRVRMENFSTTHSTTNV